jgi:hypothetical protein
MQSDTKGVDLLSRAYEDLDLVGENLLSASLRPLPDGADEWRAVGEWLILAHRMGAERVFFVGDDPVAVFSRLPSGAQEADLLAAYRRAWSLARPRCLFLATDGELRVYALSQPPARSVEDDPALEPLEVITRAADIADRLALYHRESLESGALFDVAPYDSRAGRADSAARAEAAASDSNSRSSRSAFVAAASASRALASASAAAARATRSSSSLCGSAPLAISSFDIGRLLHSWDGRIDRFGLHRRIIFRTPP